MKNSLAKEAIISNLNWLKNSGVMLPKDGSWGVGERVVLTENNSEIDNIRKAFPACTQHEKHCIVEQRRADCNFEVAYYFLEAYSLFGDEEYFNIATEILDYLYFKSGLLNRSKEDFVIGCWNWSHIRWEPYVYFDDNAWCIFLQLKIAQQYPLLDKKYDLTHWALTLAKSLVKAMSRTMKDDLKWRKEGWHDELFWLGDLSLPHWGGLCCMALIECYKLDPQPEYKLEVLRYMDYIEKNLEFFNVSEYSYALIGSVSVYRVLEDEKTKNLSLKLAELILNKVDLASGNVPSEHYEAPKGKNLVDTIYTINWATMSLQMLLNCPNIDSSKYQAVYNKMIELLLNIQDRSESLHLNGCWRGMYDLDAKQWGGGDSIEGGAGSIYTGWTNAPIGTILIYNLLKKSF